jgi:hypothetical protein
MRHRSLILSAIVPIFAFGSTLAHAATPPAKKAISQAAPKAAVAKPAAVRPRTPRASGLTMTPISKKVEGPIVIKPHPPTTPAAKAAPKEPTSFQLRKAGGRLMLTFQSDDPRWQLSPKAPLVVQVIAHRPLVIEPSVVMLDVWTQSGGAPSIAYRGAPAGRDQRLVGKAAYTVCDTNTRKCRAVLSLIDFTFQP